MSLRRASMLAFSVALVASSAALVSPVSGQAGLRTVKVAIKGNENNITPFTVGFGANPATNDIQHMVYDSLFWSQAKAEPEPWLAEKAEPSEGGKVWTVTLREGITWQDGKPFSPEDVAFSYEFYKKQEGASGRYAHHVSDVPSYERAEVVDGKTIKLFFSLPAPQFKIMPGADLPIIAKHVFEAIPEPAKATTNLPVGTGPFKLVELVPDQRYTFEANERYFKGKPRIDRLEMVIIKDPGSAFTALRTGDVDMVERNVPGELVDQLKGTSGIRVVEGTRFESIQMSFNARKKPLDDPKLRKAMSMGINLDEVVETVLLGRARPGRDTYLHPDSPWAKKDAGHQFDVVGANKMLDDAGYTAKDPDGVRKAPDGNRLEFAILVNSFEPLELRALQLIATQMQAIGVKYNVESLDPATLRARRSPPAPGQPPPYDAYVGNIESHAHVDPDALYYFFHSPPKPGEEVKGFGTSITGYANPEFDKLVEEATTAGADDRRRLLGQAQDILARDLPQQVLWYPDGIWAYRQAAYDGWVNDRGQGIFTKRSFLTGYEEIAANKPTGGSPSSLGNDTGEGEGTSPAPFIVGGAVLAGLVALGVVTARRRKATEEE
ncbi:MAG: ABC transporter substrate-binding protein [Actinomycetota bacterium]|nr:ABC transporter substrate-binding protein [Actinomycetota bacterium]